VAIENVHEDDALTWRDILAEYPGPSSQPKWWPKKADTPPWAWPPPPMNEPLRPGPFERNAFQVFTEAIADHLCRAAMTRVQEELAVINGRIRAVNRYLRLLEGWYIARIREGVVVGNPPILTLSENTESAVIQVRNVLTSVNDRVREASQGTESAEAPATDDRHPPPPLPRSEDNTPLIHFQPVIRVDQVVDAVEALLQGSNRNADHFIEAVSECVRGVCRGNMLHETERTIQLSDLMNVDRVSLHGLISEGNRYLERLGGWYLARIREALAPGDPPTLNLADNADEAQQQIRRALTRINDRAERMFQGTEASAQTDEPNPPPALPCDRDDKPYVPNGIDNPPRPPLIRIDTLMNQVAEGYTRTQLLRIIEDNVRRVCPVSNSGSQMPFNTFGRYLLLFGLRLGHMPAPTDRLSVWIDGYTQATDWIVQQLNPTPPAPPANNYILWRLLRGAYGGIEAVHIDAFEALLDILDVMPPLDPLNPDDHHGGVHLALVPE